MIQDKLEAKLDDVLFNITKTLDYFYAVYIDDLKVVYANNVFTGLKFNINNTDIVVDIFLDEIKNNNNIYHFICTRFLHQYNQETHNGWDLPNSQLDLNDAKHFIACFPQALLTYNHNGKYNLKQGDKLLYKGYIAEILFIEDDGDCELYYNTTSNCFPLAALDGCDVVYISKKKPKKKEMELRVDSYTTIAGKTNIIFDKLEDLVPDPKLINKERLKHIEELKRQLKRQFPGAFKK